MNRLDLASSFLLNILDFFFDVWQIFGKFEAGKEGQKGKVEFWEVGGLVMGLTVIENAVLDLIQFKSDGLNGPTSWFGLTDIFLVDMQLYLEVDVLCLELWIAFQLNSEGKPVIEGNLLVFVRQKVPEYLAKAVEDMAFWSSRLGGTIVRL